MELPIDIWADMQEDQGTDTSYLRAVISYAFMDSASVESHYDIEGRWDICMGDGEFVDETFGNGMYFVHSGNGLWGDDPMGNCYSAYGDG